MVEEESSRRREVMLFVLVACAEALLLSALAWRHGVNPDEGFYLAGASRVLQGKRIYADFFFPQMPYLPYLQAAQIAVSGASILIGRLVSIVPGALTAGLLCAVTWRWTRQSRAVWMVAIAYATHVIFWNYLTVTKTYGLANFWLVFAFVLIASRSSGWRAFGAGFCGGMAIGVRLPAVAVVGTLFLWQTWRDPRRAIGFAAGAVLALLPCLWIASQDFDAFWFGNVGFHSLRRELTGFGPIVRQKVLIVGRWLLLPQNLVLWLAAGWGVVVGGERSRIAMACALALAVAYLSATPTYLEYTAQIIPFLLLAAVPALPVMMSRQAVTATAVGVYLVGLAVALRPAGDESYRGRKLNLWRFDQVNAITDYLHSEAAPDDQILSWWEGYPVLARRQGFTGIGFWESNVAKKLPPDRQKRYHVLSREEIRGLVEERKPRLVLFPDGVWEDLIPALTAEYQPAERFGVVQVYRRRDREIGRARPEAAEAMPPPESL